MRIKAIGIAILFLAMTFLFTAIAPAGENELLRGDVWQSMNQDEKVAFLWGAGQVVRVENEIMAAMPQLKVENFSAKVAEGLSNKITANNLIKNIDNYYNAHPEKNSMPVMLVIWDTTIKPNLKTGIGGRPLQ